MSYFLYTKIWVLDKERLPVEGDWELHTDASAFHPINAPTYDSIAAAVADALWIRLSLEINDRPEPGSLHSVEFGTEEIGTEVIETLDIDAIYSEFETLTERCESLELASQDLERPVGLHLDWDHTKGLFVLTIGAGLPLDIKKGTGITCDFTSMLRLLEYLADTYQHIAELESKLDEKMN